MNKPVLPKPVAAPPRRANHKSGHPPPSVTFRDAVVTDIPRLLEIEHGSFTSDHVTRRSFHHLLTKGRAFTLVALVDEVVAGYALVLLHGLTALARLYSFAVAPEFRGLGVGPKLLAAAEAEARKRGRAVMRLEVKTDNHVAIRQYNTAGYAEFERVHDYYEDGGPAIRMEKPLAGGLRSGKSRVPFYAQTLDFTCGPASLMMAMRALDSRVPLERPLELRLWRESTLVYMASGHGGCDPVGMALAAQRRGFKVEVFVTARGPLFLDSVRSDDKRQVMRLVQADFRTAAREANIPIVQKALSSSDLARYVDRGAVPIVLISSWRIYGDKVPHWVVVTDYDDRFIFIHDPFKDPREVRRAAEGCNVPVAREEFDRMARYGRTRLRAAVIISGKS